MRLLGDLATDRKKLLVAVLLILLLAAFLRFYHIGWSFSNNGIDEGIMIERSRLVGQGYALYSELPCDQAPLVFYMGAPFGGDVVSLRELSASLSLLAIAATMWTAKRVKGNIAMIAAGLLLSVDFTFLRESRLLSLDGISASFLAYSMLAYVLYIQKSSRLALVLGGIFVGLSAAAKLYGVLGLLGMIIFTVLEARRDKSWRRGKPVDLIILVLASAIPMALFLAFLGPGDMINGMILNQGQRTYEVWLKLSLAAYFGLNLAYGVPLVLLRRTYAMGKETRFLLCVSLTLLAFMILQPLVFVHHLALMSPPLAVLAGVYVLNAINRKKGNLKHDTPPKENKNGSSLSTTIIVLFAVGLLVSGGLAGVGLVEQQEPPQVILADQLRSLTSADDWIISGDPLICAYANRNIPPSVVNVAYRQHPDLTLEDIEEAIARYNVTVVIVCWRLAQMDGLRELLAEHDFTAVLPEPKEDTKWLTYHAALDFFQDNFGPVWIYTRELPS